MEMIWLVLISLVGGVLQAALGFGYAVVIMVFLPMFLPIPTAAAVCCFVCWISAIALLLEYRRSLKPKVLLWPVLSFFLFMPLFNHFAIRLPQLGMNLALGIFLLALGVYYLFGSGLRISGSPLSGLGCGALSGIFSGLFAISAPPMALYCLAVLDDKQAYMGTFQLFFVITNSYGMIVRTLNGLVTGQVLLWGAVASVGMGVGMVLGTMLYKRMDLSAVKKWVYAFIGLVGLWTIISCFI